MARRPGERRLDLPPGWRRAAGWVAALAIIGAIALGVGLIGGRGEGAPTTADDGPGESPRGTPAPVTFGTALDASGNQVDNASRRTSFEREDSFAYSAPLSTPASDAVFVVVHRIDGARAEMVQDLTSQEVAAGATHVAVNISAGTLLDAWGPGEYRLRILPNPTAEPLAEGTFTLVGG